MDLKFGFVLGVGFLFFVTGALGEVSQQDLLEKRLRNIEKKFAIFDALLEGFEDLCDTLGEKKAEINEVSSEREVRVVTSSPRQNRKTVEHTISENDPTVQIVSIESSGLDENTIEVSLIFFVENDYTVRWQVRRENGTFSTEKGTQEESIVKGGPRRVVGARVTLHDADITNYVLVQVKSGNFYVQLSLNVTALQEKGVQKLTDKLEYKVLKYNPSLTVSSNILKTEGLKTIVEVSDNVVEAIKADTYNWFLFFTYINTTTSPAKVAEIVYKTDNRLSVEVKNGSTNELVLMVGPEYAQFGGLMSLVLSQTASGYLQDFAVGVSMKIINRDVQDIMPIGTIAVKEMDERMFYRGPYFTLTCTGVGVPTPDVKLFKMEGNGHLSELKVDEDIIDGIFHAKSINFNPRKNAKPDGIYLCLVSNGLKSAETGTTLQKYGDIFFDERRTGVTKNTKEKMVVSCKASGNPLPDLEFAGRDAYGNDVKLKEDERYRHKAFKRKHVSKAILTIAPPDPNIQEILCVAKQSIGRSGKVVKEFSISIKN